MKTASLGAQLQPQVLRTGLLQNPLLLLPHGARCGDTTQPQPACQRVRALGLGCNAAVGTVPPVYHSPGAAPFGVFSCGNPAGSEQFPSFEPQEENYKGAAHLAAPHSHPASPVLVLSASAFCSQKHGLVVPLRPAACAVLLWAQGLPGEVRAEQQPLSARPEPQVPSALLAQVLYQWCLPWQSFLCFFSPFNSKELFVSFLLPDCPAVTSSSLLMVLLIRAQGGLFSLEDHAPAGLFF